MTEDFVIDLAHLPKAQRDGRGQFISFALLVDQVLEEVSNDFELTDEEIETAPVSKTASNKLFYSLVLGLAADDPNYRDALLPIAAFGPEMVIAAHLGTTPPPDTEEELWWPEDLPLPARLDAYSLSDNIYKRDKNRDAAVVHSILDGSNVREPNIRRLNALITLMMISIEIGPESTADLLATQLGMAMWHTGNVQDGLSVMRALEETCGAKDTRGAWLARHYEVNHPTGPVWLQVQEMRDKY